MKIYLKNHIFTIILVLLIAIHVFLLMQLIFFPYPELFIYSYLTNKGLLPYKEIIDQHFPGLMFLPVNLKTLGIDTIPEMRLLHLSLTVVTDIIFLVLSNKIFKRKIYVVSSLIMYLFWQIYLEGHVLWIESFMTPLILLASFFIVRYMDENKVTHLYKSAFIFGILILFKQTIMPLIFFLFVYLLIKKTAIKKILISLFLVLTPFVFILVHFYRLGLLNDFIYWTFTFNLTIFSQMGKTHPSLIYVFKLLPIFGFSFASIIYLVKKHETKRLGILCIFLFGTLFFAYARFDFIHLHPALPYSVIISLLSIKYFDKEILIPFLFVYWIVSLYIFIPNYKFYNSPGLSPMLNDPETISLVNTINKYKTIDDKVFALGTYPHIYYLMNSLPPGRFFSFQFPWFMKIAETRVLQGIIRDPPAIIIRDRNSRVDGYKLIDYMQKIEGYVEDHYKVIDSVNNIEILEKI